MHKSVPVELRAAISGVLLGMNEDVQGDAILEDWGISRFAPAVDASYDSIRKMSAEARRLSLA